ncbi:hypothetical protein HYH03_016658 [Edaphochlamys debaryana]|uniref:Uncharacterized protein n=1 Tax=Edaphochlamys debaryana TaxID=47281 RepID=A0A835XI52_9CHLO|nr:hypothetical protein HYH03_016658 [Edaphochlamys debaryana]|eukprot:KAG2484518.1 hypothetical protein HYH03_016658 [Edaphochlamys debaryana]
MQALRAQSQSRCVAARGAGCRPAYVCRSSLRCHASASVDPLAAPSPSGEPASVPARPRSMIRSLAASIEINGQVQKFESLAGRSAMIGVAVAMGIELITERGIFLPLTVDSALALGGAMIATVAGASWAALATLNTSTGEALLEAVYASLTAVQRSAASVTGTQVDKAVDYVLDTVVDGRFDNYAWEGLFSTDNEDDL